MRMYGREFSKSVTIIVATLAIGASLLIPRAQATEEPAKSPVHRCTVEPVADGEAREVDDLSADLFEIRLRNGMAFHLSRTAPDSQDHTRTFTAEERKLFFERRKKLIGTIARYLNFPRAFGYMATTKNKIVGCFRPERKSVLDELVQLQFGEKFATYGKTKQFGYRILADIIQRLDVEIWQDYEVLLKAPNRGTTFIFGQSAGLALANKGTYGMLGTQLDVGYDFANDTSYVKSGVITQRLHSAALCAEALVVLGVLAQYQLDRKQSVDRTRILALPLGFTYRSSPNTVGLGFLSGVSVSDLVAGYLVSNGDLWTAAGVFFVGKVGSLLAIYSTDTTVAPWGEFARMTKKKFMSLFRREKCEEKVKNDQ